MREWLLIILLVSLVLVSGCIDPSFKGARVGGCFGGGTIVNITVEPEIDCLELRAINCNGGVVEIENNCREPYRLLNGTMRTRPVSLYLVNGTELIHFWYTGFELFRDDNGDIYVNVADGNYARYHPNQTDYLSVKGMINNTNITISYVKMPV